MCATIAQHACNGLQCPTQIVNRGTYNVPAGRNALITGQYRLDCQIHHLDKHHLDIKDIWVKIAIRCVATFPPATQATSSIFLTACCAACTDTPTYHSYSSSIARTGMRPWHHVVNKSLGTGRKGLTSFTASTRGDLSQSSMSLMIRPSKSLTMSASPCSTACLRRISDSK